MLIPIRKILYPFVLIAIPAIIFPGCRKSDFHVDEIETIRDNGTGTGTVTWTKDKDYLLEGIALGHSICDGWIDIASKSELDLPHDYGVSANYPNPFNPATTIQYQMPEPGVVKIRIFNLIGQYITTLIEDTKPAGHHTISWDGADKRGMQVAGGAYVMLVEMNNFKKAVKIALLK